MCGRIKQSKSDMVDYMETMRQNDYTILAEADGPRYNVPPGTRPAVIHRLDAGKWIMDRLFWGYGPAWYERPPVRNARLDKILANSPFWRGPLTHGRVIVPADGWYEWTGEKGDKQPWYIKPKDGKPLLFAAISGWKIGADAEKESGFAIVTDDSAGGMVDIHDRRPMCLTVDDARAWLDPDLPVKDALELLSTPRPESAFEWYRVTPAVGNSRYQLPDASEPI
jgi:putative SOS response-associated peptidase YedK